MIDYRSMGIPELEDLMVEWNEKKFRAKQIFKWIHSGVRSFDEMSDLPAVLRARLFQEGILRNMSILEMQTSKQDGTVKFLMRLSDDHVIECVLMKYDYGNSICISCQVGCGMGCTFCASTIGGKKRELLPGEMLGQLLEVQTELKLRISNIVLMGTGEPLDNYDAVLKFLELVNHSAGLNIGMRHITLSTCGLVPEIYRLAELNLQLTLAVSLHAPNDEIRNKTMPVSKIHPYEDLLEACKVYTNKTGRRVTFEYALIQNLNDTIENAEELASKLGGMLCHVNLIPVNSVEGREYSRSSRERVEAFKKVLVHRGIEATVRRELGSDIDAACGQLRRKYLQS